LVRIADPGILAIAFFEASAAVILLVLYFLLNRGFRHRFFRFWLAGWTLYTAHGLAQLIYLWRGGGQSLRFLSLELCFAAILLMAAACMEYAGRRRWVSWIWPAAAAGAVVMAMRAIWFPESVAVQWAAAAFRCAPFLAAGWILLRHPRREALYGSRLLAAPLLLHALHSIDSGFWIGQSAYLFRAAFDGLLDVTIGVAMAVLILESAHSRTEQLNEKLRRLTMLTTAASHTCNVNEVLTQALKHLAESLEASHGVVHLLEGKGPSSALVLRASVGFSEPFAAHRNRIPLSEPWVRRVLDQQTPFLSLADTEDPEIRAWMLEEGLSTLVLVRLPGKDSTLGLLGLGSAAPREFQEDEIGLLVNVANLLGITVQNVWLLEEVTRAQRQWMSTFDSIMDPVLVHDGEGHILRANRRVATCLGQEPSALIGRPLNKLIAREPSAAWTTCPYCEDASGCGESPDPTFGGYLLASTSEFHGPDGRRLGTVHVLKDITERKKAEEMYRSLFENVQEGVFITTPDGRFIDFNDAFMRMVGYDSRKELMAVDIVPTFYVNPADRERLNRQLRERGTVTSFEFQLRCKDGETLTVCESSFATLDSSGAIVAYQGFLLDVTERKRAEQEIRRRNRELMVLNSIGLTLSQSLELDELLGRALRQVVELFDVNLGATYLLEDKTNILRRHAAVGFRSDYAHAFPPTPVPPQLIEHLRNTRATVVSGQGLPLPDVFRDLQQKEGIAVSHVVVLWSKDRILGALTVACRSPREFSAADLNLLNAVGIQIAHTVERALLYEETRRAYDNLRRAQEQLLQSEKMAAVGQLISGVAHELNNPLTAILGYGQLLAGSEHVTPRGGEYVDKIYRQAQRTHRIVQNLLSFARQRKPERLPVRLNQILEDTLALREYDLKLSNIRIHRNFDSDLPFTSGDAHQLQQVFLNILNNAVDAIVEQNGAGARNIWVRTAASNGRLMAEFVDSGAGARDPLRVFDPFYTTKPVGKGTGLGLSICYGIVKEHGGEVTVHNSPEAGQGAVFRIWLPLLPVAAWSGRPVDVQDESEQFGRMLIVDDEDTLLELERDILASRAASILTVRSGREAIAALEREKIDVVITDVKMPGDVSGADLYRWIVRYRPHLAGRVVFTMSDANANEIRSLLDESGCPAVQKPFQVEELLAAIRKVVGCVDPVTIH
jgi:two-component system NtrC family sensor kinase